MPMLPLMQRKLRVQALEKGLHKYNNILRERVDLVDEIKALKQQNDELRQALVGYIQAPVGCSSHRFAGHLSQPLTRSGQR